MPVAALKNLIKKYNVTMEFAEEKWEEAKKIVKKEYEEGSPKFWGTVMKITKAKLAKHSKKKKKKKKKNESLEMPLFSINESFEVEEFRQKIEQLIYDIEDLILSEMPDKGDTCEFSQKICLINALSEFEHVLNGVEDSDFEEDDDED